MGRTLRASKTVPDLDDPESILVGKIGPGRAIPGGSRSGMDVYYGTDGRGSTVHIRESLHCTETTEWWAFVGKNTLEVQLMMSRGSTFTKTMDGFAGRCQVVIVSILPVSSNSMPMDALPSCCGVHFSSL